MKRTPYFCYIYCCLMIAVSWVPVYISWGQETREVSLPELARITQKDIKNLLALTKNHKATFDINVNTGEKLLKTLELRSDIKINSEKIITMNLAEVYLMNKHFYGLSFKTRGNVNVQWSNDKKNWTNFTLWWDDRNGTKAYYSAGHNDKLLYIKFSGKGELVNCKLQARTPISLQFDAEPYLVPALNLPVLNVDVNVYPLIKMAYNGNFSFNSRKWLRVYNLPDAIGHRDYEQASEFFVPLGFSGSRDAGLKIVKPSGETIIEDIKLINRLKKLYKTPFLNVTCFSDLPKELQSTDPGLKNKNTCPDPDKFDEIAERIAQTIYQREKRLGEFAGYYCEVKNESDIGTNWPFFTQPEKYDAWKLLADFHNTVSRAVKARNPKWKLGGPSSCLPRYDLNNFQRGKHLLDFTQATYHNMDYYSWHFYEMGKFKLDAAESYLFGRLSATIDLYRNQMRFLGGEKPVLITEYGGGRQDDTAISYWTHMRSASALLVQFLEYPDIIDLAVPFMVPIAWWYRNDPAASSTAFSLFKYDKDKKIKLTENAGFLKLWANWGGKNGVRIPAESNNHNVRVAAVRSGKKIYLAINNLTGHRIKVNLYLVGAKDKIKSIEQRRLYFEYAKVISRINNLNSLKNIPIAFDETSIVLIAYDSLLGYNQIRDRKIAYGNDILKPTKDETEFRITLEQNALKRTKAELRVGMWSRSGYMQNGTININGYKIPVSPDNIMRSAFSSRAFTIPVNYLEKTNEVSFNMNNKNGIITNVGLYLYKDTPITLPN